MNKPYWGLLLIVIGIILFLKSLDLLPENIFATYLNLASHYWPVILILLGIKAVIPGKAEVISKIIRWMIILLIVLWLLSWLWGRPEWVI